MWGDRKIEKVAYNEMNMQKKYLKVKRKCWRLITGKKEKYSKIKKGDLKIVENWKGRAGKETRQKEVKKWKRENRAITKYVKKKEKDKKCSKKVKTNKTIDK